MSENILMRLLDERKRPVIVVRDNGMVLFFRYKDLSEGMKEKIRDFYDAMRESGVIVENETTTAEDVMDYINFKEDEKDQDICG